jgi:hypothetical protein
LTFYSFLCNIGVATSVFDTILSGLEPQSILASLKAYPWRVPTPPASASASSKTSRKRGGSRCGRGGGGRGGGSKGGGAGEDNGQGGGDGSHHGEEGRDRDDVEKREESGAGSTRKSWNDVDMQYDDMESGASSASTSMESHDKRMTDMSGERVPLKESFLDCLAAQSQGTNIGDDYFRTIDTWRFSVPI